MERKIWLEEAIEDHIKNNPERDSVDIVAHFKLRADITLDSLQRLIEQGKVVREHISGSRYCYKHTGRTEEFVNTQKSNYGYEERN
jgi:hypothetical protein